MHKFLHIIEHTLIHSIELLPFLLISFLIIELIEHKFSNKTKKIISKSGKLGPLVGSLLGALPQCGFSIISTNLYITRIISIGTLIAVYLSTSDEMLPILLSQNVEVITIIKILGIKVAIGMLAGFIIDFILRKREVNNFALCEEEDCHCKESIIKSSIIHALKIFGFILLINFIINIIFEYVPENIIKNIFFSNSILSPALTSLFGLIPNCASSVMITELYLSGVISLGTAIGGLLTGSGIALAVLIKQNKNKKESLSILATIYFIGVISGIVLNIIGV